MNIMLVRHAEVLESYIGKYNGHIDIPLSKHGKEQAQKLAQRFKNENFDAIYCSDLLRARQTLEPFIRNTEVIFTSELREKSWGIHEGKSFEEIEASGIIYENFNQWIDALDGESIDLYSQRVKEYFSSTILQSKKKNILVITHAGFIKILLTHIQNISIEDTFTTKLPYASSILLQKDTLFAIIKE